MSDFGHNQGPLESLDKYRAQADGLVDRIEASVGELREVFAGAQRLCKEQGKSFAAWIATTKYHRSRVYQIIRGSDGHESKRAPKDKPAVQPLHTTEEQRKITSRHTVCAKIGAGLTDDALFDMAAHNPAFRGLAADIMKLKDVDRGRIAILFGRPDFFERELAAKGEGRLDEFWREEQVLADAELDEMITARQQVNRVSERLSQPPFNWVDSKPGDDTSGFDAVVTRFETALAAGISEDRFWTDEARRLHNADLFGPRARPDDTVTKPSKPEPATDGRSASSYPGSVPFMITKSQREKLLSLGYTDAAIKQMSPATALRIVINSEKP